MAVFAGPEISNEGLILYLDAANIKSLNDEPSTNLNFNSRDLSGTNYAPSTEWSVGGPDQTVFLKTYDPLIFTPVGSGATLLSESGLNGFHHLSRWGGDGRTGDHALSCYVYPITNDINNFSFGCLGSPAANFNLITRVITYSTNNNVVVDSGFIEEVPNFPGWLRIGCVINGRFGGWVGSMGLNIGGKYTGIEGNRAFYITGLQYERKTRPTMFLEAQETREWKDISTGNKNGKPVNGVGYINSSGGKLTFDGTNDYISFGNQSINTLLNSINPDQITLSITYTPYSRRNHSLFNLGPALRLSMNSNGNFNGLTFYTDGAWRNAGGANYLLVENNTYHIVATYNNRLVEVYINGQFISSSSFDRDWPNTQTYAAEIGAYLSTASMQGEVSNFMIYNRALTAAEILQNFNATRGRYGI